MRYNPRNRPWWNEDEESDIRVFFDMSLGSLNFYHKWFRHMWE